MTIIKAGRFGEWAVEVGEIVYIYPPDQDVSQERVGRYIGYDEYTNIPLFELPDGGMIGGSECWWIPLWTAEKAKMEANHAVQ